MHVRLGQYGKEKQDNIEDDAFYNYLFEKDECWKCEKEVRCIWESNEVKFPRVVKFNQSYLKGILLGVNSKLIDLVKVYSWVKHSDIDIQISLMTISDDEYRLLRNDLTESNMEILIKNINTFKEFLCNLKYDELAIEPFMMIPNGILYKYCQEILSKKLTDCSGKDQSDMLRNLLIYLDTVLKVDFNGDVDFYKHCNTELLYKGENGLQGT